MRWSAGSWLGVVCSLVSSTALANIDVVEGAPSGFEQMDTPRATQIVLVYGGELLGNFPAHFRPGSMAFDDVDEVLKQIPTIKDKEKVKQALSGPLLAHADLLCRGDQSDNCGKLTPDVAGVIFDEAHLSAELFINPNFLGVSDSTGPRYLPAPADSVSSIYNLNGAVAGTNQHTPSYAFNNNAVAAFGDGKFTADTSVSNSGLRFDTAAASIDRQGIEAQAGLFRSRPMQLLADHDMAGVSIGTSMNTLLDQRKISGNDIILYLPTRSIVSIYRDGKLYSSRNYEAGNQHIDTSELPQGAYTITLRIQEADGTTHEETRFFAKTPDIPPPDFPTYYLQAGVLRRPAEDDRAIPELTGHPIVRAGTIERVQDDLALEASTIGLQDRAALETGAFIITGSSQVHGTLMGSTKGDTGAQGSYLYVDGAVNASIDARRVWAVDVPHYDPDPIIQSLKQVTASTGYMITPDITIGARADYASEGIAGASESYGPTLQWYIWRAGEDWLNFTAQAGRSDHEYAANMFLQFSMKLGEYGTTSTAGFNRGDNNTGPYGSFRVFRDTTTVDRGSLIGATVQRDAQNQSLSTDGNWRTDYGVFNGFAQENHANDGNTLSYSSNFAFNVAQWDDGLHVGGGLPDTSAIIVDLKGDADMPMKIMINGSEHGTVSPGERRAVYLSPYESYSVRLVALHSALLDYDSNIRKVVLYPGTVTRLTWEVNHFYVVLAKLVSPDGKPLVEADLQGMREPISTDDEGRIQAQMARPTRLTFITQDDTACETILPEVKPVNGVMIYAKPLVCQPLEENSLRVATR